MDLSKVRPLDKYVIVQVIPVPEYVHGLTVVHRKKHWEHTTREGSVLAVGPLVKDIKVGDTVIFPGHAGKWVDAELTDASLYRAVNSEEILGTIEPETVAKN